ncbi:MAG: YraN family protein [Sphingomonadaceae bacterium]|nr:YraN family protein [Sphingomonadaceae bacterium]
MKKPGARQLAEKRGRRAETIAAWWLRLHGWRILARRVRTHWGEGDLIARRGRIVAFVEVKARGSTFDLTQAIDERRLKRVAAAASALAPRYLRARDDMRIDVILVGSGLPKHLANVRLG